MVPKPHKRWSQAVYYGREWILNFKDGPAHPRVANAWKIIATYIYPFPILLGFERVYVDIVGLLAPSGEYTYLSTIVDRFTRWGEAIPLTAIDARTVCDEFFSYWVTRFGVPSMITSNKGCQFKSSLRKELDKRLGTKTTEPRRTIHSQTAW